MDPAAEVHEDDPSSTTQTPPPTHGHGDGTDEALQGDYAAASLGVQSFAAALSAPLLTSDENVVFSPFSISAALHLAMLGARGETLAAMRQGLFVNHGADAVVHDNFHQLQSELQDRPQDAAPQVRIANRVWVEQGLEPSLNATYQAQSASLYGAGVGVVDFVGSAESARQEINAWVSTQTEEMIPELLPANAVDASTATVLTNAVYFLGDWVEAFDPERTQTAPFHCTDDRTVDVPLMNRLDSMRYDATDTRQVVALPYVGEEWALYVILPRPGMLSSVGAELLSNGFRLDLSDATQRVNLSLPRFRAAWGESVADALKGIGFQDIFSAGADFGGLLEGGSFQVGDVIHEAIIEVDETGTEAAAATAVVMARGGRPQPMEEMRVDRPFYFLLMHEPTQTPLFVGRVMEPEQPLRR